MAGGYLLYQCSILCLITEAGTKKNTTMHANPILNNTFNYHFRYFN